MITELEKLLPQECIYKEKEFSSTMNQIRAAVGEELQKGCKMVSEGKVSEKEYFDAKRSIVDAARVERTKLLLLRQEALESHIQGFDRALSGVQGQNQAVIDSYVNKYTELNKVAQTDPDEVIKAYSLAVKVGDEVGIRAAGLVGFEESIKEITEDYRKKNPSFFEVAEQQANFNLRFFGDEGRFYDALGTYRQISEAEYPETKETFQAGFTPDAKPYFRNRFKQTNANW